MKTKSILAFASLALMFALAPRGKVTTLVNPPDRQQELVDRHMSSEAALDVAERKAVAAARTDLWQDEEQQRAAVRKIRRDFRAQGVVLTALHDTEKKALDAELL